MPFFIRLSEKSLMDQETFENRPKESEEGSHGKILEKIVGLQAEETKSVQFLGQGNAWHNLRNSKETSVAEQNEQGRKVVGEKAREAVGGAHMCSGRQRLEFYSQ